MEKKSIGSFIAALRKAQGLTQRELAERLGVSDKAVSRWEREETLPDLSLIPALAELFGVTADELLRGQRSAAPADPDREERETRRTEKELQNLLRRRANSFLTASLTAAGVALLGVPAAACFNAAGRAELGFYGACFFLLAAAFLETVFLVRVFQSLGEDYTGEAVDACRRKLACWAGRVYMLIAALAGGVLPLLFLPMKAVAAGLSRQVGLQGLSWPLYGTLSGALFLALAAGLNVLVRRRLPFFPATQEQRTRDRLRQRCILGAALAMLCTAPVHYWLATDAALYREELLFDSYEDFAAYISRREEPAPGSEAEEPADYSLQNIVNSKGETVCTYRHRNRDAVTVAYPDTETCLPIRVGTQESQREAEAIARTLGQVLLLAYPLEAGLAALICFLRKKKSIPKP